AHPKFLPSTLMVHFVPPQSAFPGLRSGRCSRRICIGEPSLEDGPTCIAHLSHASIGRCAGLARAGWLPVAHSVLLAFRLEGAMHLERAGGRECVAKCSHHSNASGDHVLARLAPRVLAVGTGFAKSGCGFHLSFAPALPAHAGTSAEG